MPAGTEGSRGRVPVFPKTTSLQVVLIITASSSRITTPETYSIGYVKAYRVEDKPVGVSVFNDDALPGFFCFYPKMPEAPEPGYDRKAQGRGKRNIHETEIQSTCQRS